jgi:hypothetical protein
MSRPVCVFCSAMSVAINALAPASNTKDAAICVTAKIRCRRLELPVTRTLPLDRLNPLGEPEDEGENPRGDDGQSRSNPKQARIDSEIERSSGEARGVAGQESRHRLGAQYTERGASTAKQKAFGQQHAAQRASACAESHADRQFAFAPNRPRQNQVGDIAAGDDEDQS